MNKTAAVLKHLKDGKGITSMQAFEMFGATRLSDIIFRLRKRGYDIVNVDRDCVDRYGNDCRFVEYRLKK